MLILAEPQPHTQGGAKVTGRDLHLLGKGAFPPRGLLWMIFGWYSGEIPHPMDKQSKEKARVTLEQALDRGLVDEGIYWQNENGQRGYVTAGRVTVLRLENSGD